MEQECGGTTPGSTLLLLRSSTADVSKFLFGFKKCPDVVSLLSLESCTRGGINVVRHRNGKTRVGDEKLTRYLISIVSLCPSRPSAPVGKEIILI